MSYEPSHRKPPRQERWPDATPGEGWPAYQQAGDGRAWEPAGAFAGSRNGYNGTANGYDGNGTANGYNGTVNGYAGTADGYAGTADGHGDAWGGGGAWDGRGAGGGAWDGRGDAGYGDPGQGYWGEGNGYGGATTAYPAAGGGYADGFDGAADGYAADGYAADGYAGEYQGAADGYGQQSYYETPGSWDGYSQPGREFTADYPVQEEYPGASSVMIAPDVAGEWWRQPEQGEDRARGAVASAVMGLLAAAVAIGVATLTAAFVRPQASPVTAVRGVFISWIPATLRNHLMAHFGAHSQTVLLLGAVGLAAIVIGCMARRNASVGVAGIAAFGLLGAFVAITRPESRASDVIPSAIGGLAGIVALMWLARASAPAQVAYSGGGRRRSR